MTERLGSADQSTRRLVDRLTRRQLEALTLVSTTEARGQGVPLRVVAAALRLRPPSAMAHLNHLEALGLLRCYRGKRGTTPKGHDSLNEYLRRHRVTEIAFSRAGLPPDESHTAALEVDLSLRSRTVDVICKASGHPTACPHGFPIAHSRGSHSK
jgi:Mn-dependent DtxR family transcriptional regulator